MTKLPIDFTEFAGEPLMPEGGEPFELVVDFSKPGYDRLSLRDECALVLDLDDAAIEALGVDWDRLEANLEVSAQRSWRLAKERNLPVTLDELRADLRGWVWAALEAVVRPERKVDTPSSEL